jgi:hypothetical protein
MSTIDQVQGRVSRVLWAGAAAGVVSGIVNSAYFIAYQAVVGREYPQTSLTSIVGSSLFPSLLGAGAALGLARYTSKAGSIFALVTLGITGLSLLSAFSPELADGVTKPPGFDALVLPMHVVVGAASAWSIPRALRGSQ